MAPNLIKHQLLPDGLPLNLNIRGFDFYRDLIALFRGDGDNGVDVANYSGPDGRSIEFSGPLSPEMADALRRVQWLEAPLGLVWRDTRTNRLHPLANLGVLTAAAAEGFA